MVFPQLFFSRSCRCKTIEIYLIWSALRNHTDMISASTWFNYALDDWPSWQVKFLLFSVLSYGCEMFCLCWGREGSYWMYWLHVDFDGFKESFGILWQDQTCYMPLHTVLFNTRFAYYLQHNAIDGIIVMCDLECLLGPLVILFSLCLIAVFFFWTVDMLYL